jgi:propionaldehyde dehydrogenase
MQLMLYLAEKKEALMLNDLQLEDIVKKVINDIKTEKNLNVKNICGRGIFPGIGTAIDRAYEAQQIYNSCTLEKRREIISLIRKELLKYIEEMAEKTVIETKMGRIKDKIQKNILAVEKTPGVEDLATEVFTGDNGLTLVELSAFGVLGSVTPVTNPTETIINNTIGALAGGNSIVFCPHPSAKNICIWLIKKLNEIITEAGGPENLVTSAAEAGKENVDILFSHERIDLLLITGGTEIVKKALKSGKKVIGAGAGNPPVIVDETADIEKAAKDIVSGAGFDNNLPCIAEKEVFVLESVADYLIFNMQKAGAFHITDREDIKKLELTICKDGIVNKELIGKDAGFILEKSGIKCDFTPVLLTLETDVNHVFVRKELMMPVLAVVRQKNFEEALKNAIHAEHGLKHTAIMHSQNVTRLSTAAREMQTTIFVKNAPSYAALGFQGEGYTTFTIAGPTGEGLTSARNFTRKRRCILGGSFSIR